MLTYSSNHQQLPKQQQQVCHFIKHHNPVRSEQHLHLTLKFIHSWIHSKERQTVCHKKGLHDRMKLFQNRKHVAQTSKRFSWAAWRHFWLRRRSFSRKLQSEKIKSILNTCSCSLFGDYFVLFNSQAVFKLYYFYNNEVKLQREEADISLVFCWAHHDVCISV